ncbi:MAG: alpha/beta fold hydrolase [Kangiellaceae bacterium]|nr:alpha/beta fold hydrolase [Kangiellaceae bacterium]
MTNSKIIAANGYTVKKITVNAIDGYPLGATIYKAADANSTIILAGATGVPQYFYRHFAEFATQQSISVITFDYRGVGDSAPKHLKNFNMEYLDWAHKDLEAIIDLSAQSKLPLYLLGHSFGGHALGLISNHNKLKAAYFFGTGAGWHGWMPGIEKWKVWTMWHIIAPIITGIYGYLAWKRLGMGEDLPHGVYRDWKRWCRFPQYFFDDSKMPQVHSLFESVTLPICAANALDDKWAMPTSRDAFMKGYKNSVVESKDIDPLAINANGIGHMGYFRKAAIPLWQDAVDWFGCQ